MTTISAAMAGSFVIVSNIPAEFHTSDLRRFFSTFVEAEKFTCFHFRHRPERGKLSEHQICSTTNSSRTLSYSGETCGRVHKASSSKTSKVTNCCIVKIRDLLVPDLIVQYHSKHWLDSSDEENSLKCFISKLKIDGG